MSGREGQFGQTNPISEYRGDAGMRLGRDPLLGASSVHRVDKRDPAIKDAISAGPMARSRRSRHRSGHRSPTAAAAILFELAASAELLHTANGTDSQPPVPVMAKAPLFDCDQQHGIVGTGEAYVDDVRPLAIAPSMPARMCPVQFRAWPPTKSMRQAPRAPRQMVGKEKAPPNGASHCLRQVSGRPSRLRGIQVDSPAELMVSRRGRDLGSIRGKTNRPDRPAWAPAIIDHRRKSTSGGRPIAPGLISDKRLWRGPRCARTGTRACPGVRR
jgi:hypothetical protein